jgi:hypothetical protein
VKLKCISLWQPWASAVALGLKRNETRAYPTRHCGPLGIVATLRKNSELKVSFNNFCGRFSEFREAMRNAGYVKNDPDYPTIEFNTLPFGKLVCIVDVVGCVPTAKIRSKIPLMEQYLGDYGGNRYAWMLNSNVRRLVDPIPVCGKQGFFFLNISDSKLKFVSETLALPGKAGAART